jgi:hypothetical protein
MEHPDWETLKFSDGIVTMSRGPGHIEAKLLQLFSNQPVAILTTAEICRLVYETTQVDKKHRVAVVRALKRLGRRSMPTLWRMVLRHERSDDVWFDHRSFPKRSADCAPAVSRRPRK